MLQRVPSHPTGSARSLPSGQLVYDPRGTVDVQTVPPAPRLAALEGARVGILDNTKWNASALLRHVVARLQSTATLADVRHYDKPSFSVPADEALLDRIAAEVDLVVTAIGD